MEEKIKTVDEIEYISYPKISENSLSHQGILVYLKNHLHPYKGLPSPQAIESINLVKRILLEGSKLTCLLLSPKKALFAFERIASLKMKKYILPLEAMTLAGRELRFFLVVLLSELNLSFWELPSILSHVIEYDSAYRFRFQDIATEASIDKLVANPRKELTRLLSIYQKKEQLPKVRDKVQRIWKFLIFLLLIPRIRKAFITTLKQVNFDNFRLDEGDIYWLKLRNDYFYK